MYITAVQHYSITSALLSPVDEIIAYKLRYYSTLFPNVDDILSPAHLILFYILVLTRSVQYKILTEIVLPCQIGYRPSPGHCQLNLVVVKLR